MTIAAMRCISTPISASMGNAGRWKIPKGCGMVNNVIRNITCYGNGRGCITIARGKDNLIYNNVIYNNPGSGIGMANMGARIFNNTFYHNNISSGVAHINVE